MSLIKGEPDSFKKYSTDTHINITLYSSPPPSTKTVSSGTSDLSQARKGENHALDHNIDDTPQNVLSLLKFENLTYIAIFDREIEYLGTRD